MKAQIINYSKLMIVYYFICIATTLRVVRSKVRISIRIRDFYVLQNFQTGSGAHLFSSLMKTGVLPRAEKLPGRAFNYSSPFRAVVKNEWGFTSTPPICLHGAYREKLTFLTFFTRILYHVSDVFPCLFSRNFG